MLSALKRLPLTRHEKRDLVLRLLQEDPTRTNIEISYLAGVNRTTVATARLDRDGANQRQRARAQQLHGGIAERVGEWLATASIEDTVASIPEGRRFEIGSALVQSVAPSTGTIQRSQVGPRGHHLRKTTDAQRAEVIRLRGQGFSFDEIESATGVKRTTAQSIVQKGG